MPVLISVSPVFFLLDFEVRASLYNRMNDHCQDCQKGHLSLRKNRMAEKKDFPSPFHFTGNPTLFYLQVSKDSIYK